jgi:integrase
MRKGRKTLLELGPRRGPGRIRVYEDRARQIVTVQFSGRRKESFTLTPAGRREAMEYAAGLAEGRRAPAAADVVTVRELWQRYAEANAGDMRPRTFYLYRSRWNLFEKFIVHDTPAGAVTLEHLDRFKADLLKQKYAPNQVKHTLGQVKRVYRWAGKRKAVIGSDVPLYEIKFAKDARAAEPAEYRLEDFERLVPAIGSPQEPREWRSWALLMLIGHQGIRINAALHLRVSDVRGGRLWWDAAWDKLGRTWSQPIRDGALSAILTALWWRERDGYTGPWLFYPRPGGTLGGRADREGRHWEDGHRPYHATSFYLQLAAAEKLAGVPHLDLRGAHGLRKMVAGEVLRATGNPKAAMDFIGDYDLSLVTTYLKVREDQKAGVADLLDTRNMHPERTQRPDAETAPVEVGAAIEVSECRRSDSNRHGLLLVEGAESPIEHKAPAQIAEKAASDGENGAEPSPKPAPDVHPKSCTTPTFHIPGGV